MRLTPILAAIVAVLGFPAAAQDRPVLAPTRDATIDYKIEGRAASGPQTLRMMFAAGGTKTRIELPGGRGYMIMDRGAARILVVMEEARRYMERPLTPGQASAFDLTEKTATFTRKGSETIAGLRCTVWETKGERTGTGCVTDDGLVLRGESAGPDGKAMRLIATAVSTARLGPEVFQPPAGFTAMTMPTMPPGAMPPGATMPPGPTMPPGTAPRP